MTGAALTGFATSISLILAIGAQNALVLRQGLVRSHVLTVVLFCAFSDALLISAGVMGFDAITGFWPWLPRVMAMGGAVFLLFYGALRFRAAWRGGESLAGPRAQGSLWPVIGTAAALTWLNPHVYLDTMGLIGAVSAGFEGRAKLAFGLGAVAASFVFFFALGYGARLLAPAMRSPPAWRVLDSVIGVTMWAIAAALILG
ncbi:L-lysine exporter family protein LysE/ArgO [Rhodovulum imhoffii]|uniref:L-lysine exporter family protein LysE/ArgO n=1 Tax=Rhodovulum imhoffii TaxID=365340 RepID=A0A2T5BTT2_9RHOB|nr:LysE/ArgO family amino acid transporter [Rhodovulum imhoffii]MBK5934113.1 amino acid transporter [Rhodovulum imhoffii]PTN02814.1 L-lysine exporter family protein LysE/ArgO [Rhodovulum imhoffii]